MVDTQGLFSLKVCFVFYFNTQEHSNFVFIFLIINNIVAVLFILIFVRVPECFLCSSLLFMFHALY